MKYLLDTHAWIWWNMEPGKLSRKARKAIEDVDQYDELLLSAISVWEFCKLIEKKRLAISCDARQWMSIAMEMPKLRLAPLTPAVAHQSTVLPAPFHGDPTDQIIVATAREENATTITSDKRIRDYQHVRSLW